MHYKIQFYFQKGVDNFVIEHKTCLFLVRDAVPPLRKGIIHSTAIKIQYWQMYVNQSWWLVIMLICALCMFKVCVTPTM